MLFEGGGGDEEQENVQVTSALGCSLAKAQFQLLC